MTQSEIHEGVTPLEEEIIRVLTDSAEPLTSAELLEEIPDCPDRETLARVISRMMMTGRLVKRNVLPKSSTFPCGGATAYTLPGRAAPKPQQETVKATETEAAAEPVKTAQPKQRRGMTIKEQIAEMVRGIPETLAISKEDIIRHLPHVKRSTILSFIPLMVREGEALAAIGNTLNRRYFDIRTKGAESVKPESASVIKPLSYEMKPPVSIDASLIETQPPVPPVPHVMRQAVIGQADLDPVFALDTNGRLRIEQGEHIILCGTTTVRKLALLLSIGKHVY